jgi:hypothetical protein
MYEKESDFSLMGQLDGNVTNLSDVNIPDNSIYPPHPPPPQPVSDKPDRISAARCLPVVATYNLRSLLPNIGSLTTDILERKIDCGFLSEIWEQDDNKNHQFEIETLLELHGLKYLSTTRKPNSKGVSYGGAAILVNLEKFSCEKVPVQIPQNLEVLWGLLRPKNAGTKFKKIIVCSFYSPPNKQRNSKMADHIVGTLHMLAGFGWFGFGWFDFCKVWLVSLHLTNWRRRRRRRRRRK